ncbi:MAG: hypothetical protein JXB13_15100 [Phycisphaerae bacterium]|nr:hypothetical protein [Phycisphaerae bacterium]
MSRLPAGVKTDALGVEKSRGLAVAALRLLLGLIGLHSIGLGLIIYMRPDWFARVILAAEPETPFFLRQVGVFLVCLGFVYGFPLLDLTRYHRLVLLTIGTKLIAVLFLLTNARLAPASGVIQLAALGDGLMTASLVLTYALARRHVWTLSRAVSDETNDVSG